MASVPNKTTAEPSKTGPDLDDKRKNKKKRKEIETTSDPLEIECDVKKLKVDYSPGKWHTSSSESEYEAVCHPTQVCAGNLPENVTKHELKDFFKVKSTQVHLYNVDKDGVSVKQSVIVFSSATKAKEALKLCGNLLRGKAIYVKPNGNNRDIVRVSGFNNQLEAKAVKKQLNKKFKSRGKVLHVFVPGNSETGRCLGFGYVFLEGADSNTLIQSTTIGGVSCDVKKATPKSCFQTDMVGKDIPMKQGSEEDRKTALKRMLLPLNTTLPTSLTDQTPFSWDNKRPDITAAPYEQKIHDCWAIALHRGYTARRKLSGKSGQDLTVDDLLNGVEAAHQASGKGINRIRNASSFMKNYVKEMNIHRRPRGDNASDFEGFESFIKKLLKVAPVVVTVECLPGFISFSGEGVYCPTDMDCHLRTFEKFPIHCLLLDGYDVIDGIECWKLHDSQGSDWGKDGFIMMEQHKCLIKSVVEFKL